MAWVWRPSCSEVLRLVYIMPLGILLTSACAMTTTSFHAQYAAQLHAFERLFPMADINLRNAASRTDGYWPFVGRKEEPPTQLTYGEFPLEFFTAAVDRAVALSGIDRTSATFCDIGSGAGRLVLWAAATLDSVDV